MSPADCFCPCCGDTLDSFGDHALVCRCKGDRTVRHSVIRDIIYAEARLAGLAAERENPGLLPARPAEDGVGQDSCLRRPADVWLPRTQGGPGQALDLACTSGLRSDVLGKSADGETVFPAYEDLKKSFKNTDEECSRAGFRFVPLVIEAHGGSWSPLARGVLDKLAKAQVSAWSEGQEPASLRIAQRISCSLQRENARAVLRRLVPPSQEPGTAGWGDLDPELTGFQ